VAAKPAAAAAPVAKKATGKKPVARKAAAKVKVVKRSAAMKAVARKAGAKKPTAKKTAGEGSSCSRRYRKTWTGPIAAPSARPDSEEVRHETDGEDRPRDGRGAEHRPGHRRGVAREVRTSRSCT